ncbi:sulfurtransferase TusA family protein [Azospirillum doebereinerae]|uniref:Sulfurtransferase TusA family protein n=1 Tax=Azospirillum doebereinerae TaxID=92933 RepID=A0A3S0WYY5_9PROT|nr:sulfurtransferase TusA family protein [Azospirillum doebereinerae]RUQ70279.1 sulfurtransferase TusA family protein [Azospirillum doebereinerae]
MAPRTRYSHTRNKAFAPAVLTGAGLHPNRQGAGVVPATELDVRGLHCPLPILRTRALLDRMAVGDEVVVTATDPASVIDFKHFCNTTENELLAHETRPDDTHTTLFIYRIRRGG